MDESPRNTQTPDGDTSVVTDVELVVRASRLKQLTYGQYKAIRQTAIEFGLPPEVASTLPWLAADPQVMVSALRAAPSRKEIIVRGVLGTTIEIDVVTAMILRSLENMRAEEHRYRGMFSLPRYTSAEGNSALRTDLSDQPSVKAASSYISEQLEVVDAHINRYSPYGDDIRRNGTRRGGVLFPVVIDLPGDQRIGGFDSTDCYSRTLFSQHHSGIKVPDVLSWWHEYPPTSAREFKDHPLKALRDNIVEIVEKIVGGSIVDEPDREAVLRAVMPKTTLVLKVSDTDGLGIDEIRRRLVSERHLDKQLEFTVDTKNETRAEAVIVELGRGQLLPERPGFTQGQMLDLLENPRAKVEAGAVHVDDIMVAAAAVFLPQPRSVIDRAIFPAIASRGVITQEERTKWLRSELATQVIMRVVEGDFDQRDLRRSALAYALRGSKLKGARLDDRPVPELLAAALAELNEVDKARQQGESPEWGGAMRQIVLRGAFHLIFGRNLALSRSPVGGKAGVSDNREPAQILEKLGTMAAGQQQLAQAIYDGRNGVAVRLLAVGDQAQDLSTEPAVGATLDNPKLRAWLVGAVDETEKERQGNDDSARARVHQDALKLRALTEEVEGTIDRISGHADPVGDDRKGKPHVSIQGLRDTDGLGARLSAAGNQLTKWHTVYEVRSGNEEVLVGESV